MAPFKSNDNSKAASAPASPGIKATGTEVVPEVDGAGSLTGTPTWSAAGAPARGRDMGSGAAPAGGSARRTASGTRRKESAAPVGHMIYEMGLWILVLLSVD